MNPEPRIVIAKNGPYIVSGGPRLSGRRPMESRFGEPLEWEPIESASDDHEMGERYALCRCGESSRKPFCDGTHTRVGFDGTLTATPDPGTSRRAVFAGEGVTMTDNPTLCSDAGFCGTRLTNVWSMIDDTSDPEVRERLKRMVALCPSGRLEFSEPGGAPIEPQFNPTIAPIPNGPLWVRGGIPVQAMNGTPFEVRNRMTLCRCGQSQNKPFCDGAHKSHAFEAP